MCKNEKYTLNDIKNMLNSVPYAMWIKDENKRYRYVNNEFEKLVHISRENIIGKIDEEMKFMNLELGSVQEEATVKGRTLITRNYKIEIKNKTKYIETHMWPLYKKGEKANWIGGLARDISEDMNIKNEIIKIVDIEPLEYSKNDGNEDKVKNKDNNINMILDGVMKKLDADGISIFLYDEKTKLITAHERVGLGKYIPDNYSFEFSDSKVKEFMINDIVVGPLKFNESELLKKYIQPFYDHDEESYVNIYPIRSKKEFIGTLSIHYLGKNLIKTYHNNTIKTLAYKLSLIYIARSLSYNLKYEISKRIKTEHELKNYLDTAADLWGTMTIDKENRIISITEFESTNKHKQSLTSKDLLNIKAKLEGSNIIFSDESTKDYRGNFLCKIKNENNQDMYIEFNTYFISSNKAIITGRDKTIQLKLEDNNRRLESNIALDNLKNEFFANLSHEFKTPLNIIITATQLIYSNKENINFYSDEEMNKYIKVVKQNTYRLLKLINNLIDITILDKGYYELKLSNYNIVKIIEEIVKSLKEYIGDKQRNIYFNKHEDNVVLACDPEKIERIMLNLLSNSIKYTDKNGSIKVESKVNDTKNKILISVENDGEILSEEDANVIFQRFTRADNILTRRCEGSGIGLALVKSLVELHGGKIWIDNNLENKTKFIFELPIKKIAEDNIKVSNNKISVNKIEKCNIEFSDIYSI